MTSGSGHPPSKAEQDVWEFVAQAPIGLFHRKDDLVIWLRTAADAYGSTLRPDGVSGVVALDPGLSHAKRVETIKRGFGPITYDDEKSLEDHMSAAVHALGHQLRQTVGFDAHLHVEENVRKAVLEALGRWRSSEGEHVLYVLLGVALRFDVKEASVFALDLLARGQLAASSETWKKALGVRMSVIGREQASLSARAAELLESLQDRQDFWTPHMIGNVTSGLVAAQQRDWEPIFMRHLDQVEQLKPREQRMQYGRIADAVGVREFIVDCLSLVPSAFGWDGQHNPRSAKKEYRLIKAVLEPRTSPLDLDRNPGEPQFVRRDIHIELQAAAGTDQVVDGFKRVAPPRELDVIDVEFSRIACREKVDDLRPPQAPNAQDPFDFLEPDETEFITQTGMYDPEQGA